MSGVRKAVVNIELDVRPTLLNRVPYATIVRVLLVHVG